MRYTGIAVALIGVVILAISLIMSLVTSQPAQQSPDVAASTVDLIFPIVIGVVALVAGGGMYAYGGRGVISSRDPAVRN